MASSYEIVIATVSDTESSYVDVTVIVAVPVASDAICTTPPSVIVTPSLSLEYVTVCGAKPSVTTTVESARLEPADTVADAGVTVTLVTLGSVGTYRSAFEKGDVENVFH